MRTDEERPDPQAVKWLSLGIFGFGLATLGVTLLHGPPAVIGVLGIVTVVLMMFLLLTLIGTPL